MIIHCLIGCLLSIFGLRRSQSRFARRVFIFCFLFCLACIFYSFKELLVPSCVGIAHIPTQFTVEELRQMLAQKIELQNKLRDVKNRLVLRKYLRSDEAPKIGEQLVIEDTRSKTILIIRRIEITDSELKISGLSVDIQKIGYSLQTKVVIGPCSMSFGPEDLPLKKTNFPVEALLSMVEY